jgi:alpha-ribazole phosphatase
MLIDLLRHGEPVGGARYRGSTDDKLSEKGWQQMQAALITDNFAHNVIPNNVTHDSQPPWTHIISSPLRRCAAFAQRLSASMALPLHIEPRFAEIHFGDWEGLSSAQIMRQDSHRLSQYWADPSRFTPPNGETLKTFRARVANAWSDLNKGGSQTPRIPAACKHLLIITHGGVLRMVLSDILQTPHNALFNIDVPYTCLSRIELANNKKTSQLIFHNGTLT